MVGTLLKAPALDVFGQMALDETVLDSSNEEALVLRFYEWPGGPHPPERPHGATFGFMQRYDEAVASLRARDHVLSFPVVRRPTAGGLVMHDRDVTFSLIFPWSKLASPSLVYKDLHRGIHLGLKGQGIPSRLWSPGSCAPARPADCFTEPSPMDLVHEDGRKFLGGALRRKRGVGLYQGSLRPEGFFVPPDRLRKAILDGVSLEWQAALMPKEVDEPTQSAADSLRSERYFTDDWNRRL
ncbi:MAG: lipoate--protein ligase family protein [Elusimicrobia bacterium]|nr:lipoate--protein ligase family protein [Elusimicrobiota bacterium]